MTYADAIRFLYSLQLFGLKLGLENPRKLADLVGNPHERLRFIHVAGTNGKGSTCAMLEGIYRAAGLRVGLFTSPHLVSFRERIQVNREWIGEADVVRLIQRLQPLLQQFPSDHHPTFFEVVTIMALIYFAEQQCDIVIWETGMGGRLDATNIVTPLASVITNIQLDHQKWLGETLRAIAAEKAGIIKKSVPVLTATTDPGALEVITTTAGNQDAPLTLVSADQINTTVAPSLQGAHQKANAALAIATINALQGKIPVSEEHVRAGLSHIHWPGRLQLVQRPSGQKILLDGAHNVAGAEALRSALQDQIAGQPCTFILGMLEDKNWRTICERLAPLASRLYTVPVSNPRSACAVELAEACRLANPRAEIKTFNSVQDALRHASDTLVVVTGSLYLIGEALEFLGDSIAKTDERALNDWSAATADSGRP